MAYRSGARICADEYCCIIHLDRRFNIEGNGSGVDALLAMAQFLDLDTRDMKWLSPDGRDCTLLCSMSMLGGFDSSQDWTLNGWVLSEESMAKLRAEFPDECHCHSASSSVECTRLPFED